MTLITGNRNKKHVLRATALDNHLQSRYDRPRIPPLGGRVQECDG